MPEYREQRPRLLAERSRLVFEFPTKEGKPTKRVVPFFENPVISEGQSSNVVEYNPVGRAGTVFTYTGAQSRDFSVEFQVTHEHIMDFFEGYSKYFNVLSQETNEASKQLFFLPSPVGPIAVLNPNSYTLPGGYGTSAKRLKEEYFKLLTDPSFDEAEPEDQEEFIAKLEARSATGSDKALEAIIYWINLIRSSTLNHSEDPTLGPPIVRLTHGLMYQNIPCIATSYSISFDERAGYDLKTLMPRVVKVNLTLKEARFGEFLKFEHGQVGETSETSRDAVTGWESVLYPPYTIDSGGGFGY